MFLKNWNENIVDCGPVDVRTCGPEYVRKWGPAESVLSYARGSEAFPSPEPPGPLSRQRLSTLGTVLCVKKNTLGVVLSVVQ